MILGIIEWVSFLGMVALTWVMLDIFSDDHHAGDTRQGKASPDHQHDRNHLLFPIPVSQEQQVMVCLPAALVERLRVAKQWAGNRPLVDLVAETIEDIVIQMEEINEEAFPQHESPLKREAMTRRALSGPLL
ncbi:MAG: hypothetical protein ABI604_20465 [Nitrospirota bacterium]